MPEAPTENVPGAKKQTGKQPVATAHAPASGDAAAAGSPTELSPQDLDALMNAASKEAAGAIPSVDASSSPSGLAPGGFADSERSSAKAKGGSPTPAVPHGFEFPQFANAAGGVDAKRISMLSDVNLNVKIELGRTRMLVEDVLKLGEGSVVELDKLAGDPVDVYANDRLVARGEVLVLNDAFCVRINEVFSGDPHRVSQG